jgi:hypothetical protein
MKTSKLPLRAILMTLLAAPVATLGGCDLPDVEMPDDDEEGGTDGDASGGGGGSAKGLTSVGAADDGAADESGGADPADDGNADGSDGAADSGDAPTSEGCIAYCEVDLACDDYYEDAATCEQDCAISAEDAGVCAPAQDEMYACLGTLDCDAFAAYWEAIDLLLSDVDPGAFPCDAELIAVAECMAA